MPTSYSCPMVPYLANLALKGQAILLLLPDLYVCVADVNRAEG